MFDRDSAEKKVSEFINADYHVDSDKLVIVPEETIKKTMAGFSFIIPKSS